MSDVLLLPAAAAGWLLGSPFRWLTEVSDAADEVWEPFLRDEPAGTAD